MEIGGRSFHERSVLHSVGETPFEEAEVKVAAAQEQARHIRHQTHPLFRHPPVLHQQAMLKFYYFNYSFISEKIELRIFLFTFLLI